MLRRIALAITLVTGSLQADDSSAWDVPECEDSSREDDLALRPDGSIASWSLLRLVLPDLAEDLGGPEWIDTPPSQGVGPRLSLATIGGRAVAGADGAALGTVRGCLVNPLTGYVLALAVDLVADGEARRIAVPWALLAVDDGQIRYVGDEGWIRVAPDVRAAR